MKLPLYDKASFVRHLDAAGVSWRWYSYDIGTLRCVDREYLLGHHEKFDVRPEAQADAEERSRGIAVCRSQRSQLPRRCGARQPPGSVHDHPPSDVVVLYDEHGGFFDHVKPP